MWCSKLRENKKKLSDKKREKRGKEKNKGPLFIGPATGSSNHRIGDHCLGEEAS